MGARCGRLQDMTAPWQAHACGQQLLHGCCKCDTRPLPAAAAFTHGMFDCKSPHVTSSAWDQFVETAAECGAQVESEAARQGRRQQRLEKQSELMLKILQPEGLSKGQAAKYWKALAESLKTRFESGDEEDLELTAEELQSEPDCDALSESDNAVVLERDPTAGGVNGPKEATAM